MKKENLLLVLILSSILSIQISAQTDSITISRNSLVEDTRQLVRILEESRPDPYHNFGGKISFNRDFQNILSKIPLEGLSSGDYFKLMMPFVAKIADMHTGLINPSKRSYSRRARLY